jgi:DNA invertase Pin-like site-specific DNA recombinase
MFVRAYLRASTRDQHAGRPKADLIAFAKGKGLAIAAFYAENESGASLSRPELARLLADAHPGDILLIEQVDRLSRLNAVDWEKLRAELKAKHIRVVALDLPTSWQMIGNGDEFTERMADAINGMMLDMLAAIARKDYADRRRRQAQGIEVARQAGRYRGRPEDADRNAAIAEMLGKGLSWLTIMRATKCSRTTVAKVAKRRADAS